MKNKDTLVLAHYYTTPDIQARADVVGDSLELALAAQRSGAERIVFAGVRFMAETAKILNPNATVLVPDWNATCSLVEQTDIEALKRWKARHKDSILVSYINCSAEEKAISDWIVTSRNVDEIVQAAMNEGKTVLFAPDRNMGAYLAWMYPEWGNRFKVWSSVCMVHDLFKEEEIKQVMDSIPGEKWLIAHPESPLPVLKASDFIGSTSKMLEYVDKLGVSTEDKPITVVVATETGLIDVMKARRPDLVIKQAGIYDGCQCNDCPYMKLNTMEKLEATINGTGGDEVTVDPELAKLARIPVERMLAFKLS